MGVTHSASVTAPEKSNATSPSAAAVAATFATVTPYNFPQQVFFQSAIVGPETYMDEWQQLMESISSNYLI